MTAFHMEKLTARKLLGCAVGFAGVVIINVAGNGIDMKVSLLGEGSFCFLPLSYALSSGLIKRYSEKRGPGGIKRLPSSCAGGIILTAAGLICGGRVNLTGVSLGGWVLLLYMGFISAAAYYPLGHSAEI